MEWLIANWFWVLVFVLFIVIHLFGHGHGGHGGHGSHTGHGGGSCHDDKDEKKDEHARSAGRQDAEHHH